MQKDDSKIIPEHNSGEQTNTDSSLNFTNENEAINFYEIVKQRLLHVNNWQQLAGMATANFILTDKEGNDVEREAREGDYLKINIPGPGSKTGNGYDWVKIEAIEKNAAPHQQTTGMRVRPAANPLTSQQDVAHFFSDESTSSFIVKREKNKVTAAIYGRNEKPNTDVEKLIDKARNTVIATAAFGGLSKIQWKSLAEGLLKKEF